MRQSRHLLVTNLPDCITEDRISDHFKRCVSLPLPATSVQYEHRPALTPAEWFGPRQPAAKSQPQCSFSFFFERDE